MRRPRLLAAAAALLLASPLAMATSPTHADLDCRFQAATGPAGQVLLQFTLRNASPRDLHLLRWGSPFEGGWFGPFVRVSAPQGELPFQGAMRKRGEPSAQDYLLLRAGQTLTAELALDDAFALPAAGTLKLSAAWRWHDVAAGATLPRPRSRHQGLDQACGEVTLAR